MDLPRDLIDLFSAFAAESVRYLLVGGHAVAAHGRPRSTKDVDLWLAADPKNIERACRGLSTFGVPADIVQALRSAKLGDIVWLGRSPTRIDFLLSLPGVEFEEAWIRRGQIDLGGATIPVIGKEDLIRNKSTVGRPQDLRDVRALQRGVAKGSQSGRAPRRTKSR
ncbi:MAG TPA: nucleotidyltransferase [Polyangiaceae bacterium]|nr:nucleotidyltransferase [Polyangiaceae bacterium]